MTMSDAYGDVCDECTDTDGDGYGDPGFSANTCPDDNCPNITNPDQANPDGDSYGDLCDNCPNDDNENQANTDGDAYGDVCDECTDDVCDECTDTDGDGYGDPGFPANTCSEDNCATISNPYQEDTNGNGIGDACEHCGDPNNDGNINILDMVYIVNYLYKSGQEPIPLASGDVDSLNGITINDIVHLVSFKYCGGPDPYCQPLSDSVLQISNADTLSIQGVEVLPGNDFAMVDLYIKNTKALAALSIPLSFGCQTSNITCDSISFVNSIVIEAPVNEQIIDALNNKVLLGISHLNSCDPIIDPGEEGLLASLWFTVTESSEVQYITIDITDYPPSNIFIFSEHNNPYIPVYTYCVDSDGDGYGDPSVSSNTCPDDNCSNIANEDQINSDNDSYGDLCDNCPDDDNESQTNSDTDSYGDACDNCPNDDNEEQANADGDEYGDVCDDCTDTDGDTYGNPGFPANTCPPDNCPLHYNPDQIDSNGDGVGDACTFEEETPAGQDVETTLDNVDLQFDDVTIGGTTEMTVTSSGPEATAFEIVPSDPPAYYNITTDATYDGSIEICITYDDADMTSEEEESLTLLHYDGIEWVNITTSINTTDNIICGVSASLSPFVVAIPTYICGDVDGDELVNILDIVYLINYKYKEGPAPDPLESADVNSDELVNILDIVYLINYKYKEGPEPVCP